MKAIKRTLHATAVLAVFLVSTLNSPAAAYIKFDGVDGECIAPGHVGDIDLLSFSQSHSRSNTASPPILKDVVITKTLDKSSPKLAEHCATGQHIPQAKIFVRKAGGTTNDYYVVTFTDIMVTSYQTGGGSAGDDRPTESISFNYAQIEWNYQPQDLAGNPTGPPVIGRWPVAGGPGVSSP